MIRFKMPSLNDMPLETGILTENDRKIEFPLILVRNDGVIYPSDTYLSYQSSKPLKDLSAILSAVPIRNDYDEE